jgi:hypothetical protein
METIFGAILFLARQLNPVGQEFPEPGHINPVTVRIGLTAEVHPETNRAHDAVVEFFVNQLFQRGLVNRQINGSPGLALADVPL